MAEKSLDGGPAQVTVWGVSNVPVTSADLTTATAVTDAPPAKTHLVVSDVLVSADTNMKVTFTEETSGTVMFHIRVLANTTSPWTPRGKRKLPVAAKKLYATASATGNIEVLVGYYYEGATPS